MNVTPVNDAPVVTPSGTLSYTENQAATAIDAALTVSDVDSANLTGATVPITGNFVDGQDVLGFTTQNGITGSYNAAHRHADPDRHGERGELPDGAALGDLRQHQRQSVAALTAHGHLPGQ